MSEISDRELTYDLQAVKLPVLRGWPLRLFVKLLEGPLRGLMIPGLMKSAGIERMRGLKVDEPPTMLPLRITGAPSTEASVMPESEWPGRLHAPAPGFGFASVIDYADAYRKGTVTPADAAQRVVESIAAADERDPPLRAFIAVDRADLMAQAEKATRRIREGKPLSILDGVPVAVKDELDVEPHPTTCGTTFLGRSPCRRDSTVAARLRAAGAMLIGKTGMHEIGIGVTGLNPHHGTPCNPYAPGHYPGGSSSGSGAAVAAGLCPVAIGADGGGSVRIPASFCGIVGLKPTFGRISEHGAAPICWSVAHIGPLAATAADAALAYAILAGPDSFDPLSRYQPPPTLAGWDNLDLSDLTLGIFEPWFQHAQPEVESICRSLLDQLVLRGARVNRIVIPDLEAARVAHSVTIAGEMSQALGHEYKRHHREHGPDVRINLALARTFTARDYLQAQRIRTRMMSHFDRVLEDVDAILTPATGIPAPPIPDRALPHGESDLTTLMDIMRFTTPANMTGLPAIAFPAGYTAAGLPVGLQAIGGAWREDTLLRLALAAEQTVERRPPQVHYPILP